MLTAEEIMSSKMLTIRPSATIAEAIELLLDKGISGLPVVDAEGRLMGIITEFALLAIAYDQGTLTHTVANHMTRDVLTVESDEPISRVADLCILHRVRRVPVTSHGKLVGMLSRRDVLRALYADLAACSA